MTYTIIIILKVITSYFEVTENVNRLRKRILLSSILLDTEVQNKSWTSISQAWPDSCVYEGSDRSVY